MVKHSTRCLTSKTNPSSSKTLQDLTTTLFSSRMMCSSNYNLRVMARDQQIKTKQWGTSRVRRCKQRRLHLSWTRQRLLPKTWWSCLKTKPRTPLRLGGHSQMIRFLEVRKLMLWIWNLNLKIRQRAQMIMPIKKANSSIRKSNEMAKLDFTISCWMDLNQRRTSHPSNYLHIPNKLSIKPIANSTLDPLIRQKSHTSCPLWKVHL